MQEESQFGSLSTIRPALNLSRQKGGTTKLCLITLGVMLAVFSFLGLIKKILLLQELNTEYLQTISKLQKVPRIRDKVDQTLPDASLKSLSDQSSLQLQDEISSLRQKVRELQKENEQFAQSQVKLKDRIQHLSQGQQSWQRCRQENQQFKSIGWVRSPDDVIKLIAQIDQKRRNQNSFRVLTNSTLIKFGADEHYFDSRLYELLVAYYEKKNIKTIVDFGCGKCEYIAKLHNEKSYETQGYDGSPYSNDSLVKQMDLSQHIDLGKGYDFVQSFEVGEHIFSDFEDNFIENIVRHAEKGILMSWAVVGQPGYMHVNNRNNDYLIKKVEKLGFAYNKQDTIWFRSRLTNHFSSTIMVFTKIY